VMSKGQIVFSGSVKDFADSSEVRTRYLEV